MLRTATQTVDVNEAVGLAPVGLGKAGQAQAGTGVAGLDFLCYRQLHALHARVA